MSFDLKGGKFLGQGSATCVFFPRIECEPGTLQGKIPGDKNLVSRLIPTDEKEFQNQIEIREAIKRLDSKYIGLRFADHFNVAVATCTPEIRQEDLQTNQKKEICSVPGSEDLKTVGVKGKYINFITKLQGKNLYEYQNFSSNNAEYAEVNHRFRTAFFELMNATIALNSEGIVHYDLHSNNIAWTLDNFPQKNLVIFDWGYSLYGFDNFIKYLCDLSEDVQISKPTFKNMLKGYSNYSQYKLQIMVLKKIYVGVNLNNVKDVVKNIQDKYVSKKLETKFLTPLEKLFYCWDTYSLINQLLINNYPGLRDLKPNKFSKLNGKSFLSPQKILEYVNAHVLSTDFSRNGGLQLFVQSLWDIVGFAFNEKPVVQNPSTFTIDYKALEPNQKQIFAANQEFEKIENAPRRRLSYSMHSSPVQGPLVDGLSPSPIYFQAAVKSPFASVQGSLYLKKSKSRNSSSRSRKSFKLRAYSRSHSRPISVKSKTCSGNMVLDSSSKSCRERKKPGPKSKSKSYTKTKSPCPRNMVRDKISKKCRDRKKPGRKPSCPVGQVRDSKSKRCVKSKKSKRKF